MNFLACPRVPEFFGRARRGACTRGEVEHKSLTISFRFTCSVLHCSDSLDSGRTVLSGRCFPGSHWFVEGKTPSGPLGRPLALARGGCVGGGHCSSISNSLTCDANLAAPVPERTELGLQGPVGGRNRQEAEGTAYNRKSNARERAKKTAHSGGPRDSSHGRSRSKKGLQKGERDFVNRRTVTNECAAAKKRKWPPKEGRGGEDERKRHVVARPRAQVGPTRFR